MPSLLAYQAIGRFLVQGWMQPDVMRLLRVLREYQENLAIDANVVEIGVHHGKLFIPLQLVSAPSAKALAIDVFGDQDLNVDQSGRGDYGRFVRNVSRWGRPESLVVHQGDSTAVTRDAVISAVGGGVQLFSVDGGHTREIVRSDMNLAAETIVPGGIIIADDVFNSQWPEVVEGTLDFVSESSAVVPFAIGFNKVFFTTQEHAEGYISMLSDLADQGLKWGTKVGTFAGRPVFILFAQPRSLRALVSKIPFARTAYRRLSRRPLSARS